MDDGCIIRYNRVYEEEWLIAIDGFPSARPYDLTYKDVADGVEWCYWVRDGKAIVGGDKDVELATIPQTTSGKIEIPSELGGCPVVGVGEYAFCGCHALTSVTIPSNVTNIGDCAFSDCLSLSDVYFEGDIPPSLGTDCFSGWNWNLIIHVPSTWQGRAKTIGGVTIVKDGVVPGETQLDLIEIPLVSSVEYVGGGTNKNISAFVPITNSYSIVDAVRNFDRINQDVARSVADVTNGIPTEIRRLVRESARMANLESIVKGLGGCLVAEGQSQCGERPGPVVNLTATNVIVHYIQTSERSPMTAPITEDVGIVNVITEIMGGNVAIPDTWVSNYPTFTTKYGSDFPAALTKPSGKKDASGNPMMVWQDYVAGTDPTDEKSVFKASVTMVDGVPVVSYTPELTADEKARRKYTTLGKAKLHDPKWVEVPSGREADYNFFKVTVEMK